MNLVCVHSYTWQQAKFEILFLLIYSKTKKYIPLLEFVKELAMHGVALLSGSALDLYLGGT
jgi:hypothetical protein